MGWFNDLLGGGDQVTKTQLPGYMEGVGKRIGYGVDSMLAQQAKPGGDNMSATQRDAIQKLRQQAYQGSGLGMAPTQALQGMFANQGMDPGVAGLSRDLMYGQFENPAMGGVRHIAAGMDVGQNPYLDDTFNRGARGMTEQYKNTISPGMTSAAAQRGRLGSGAYARMRGQGEEGLAQGLSGLANQVYGGAYENERGRQMQALGLQGQMGQQDIQNRALGAGMFDTGLNRVMQSIGLTPQAMGAQYADAQQLLNVGNTERDLQFRPYQSANAALSGTPFGQTQVGTRTQIR